MKNQKGITLVALVITIIVLLILAGVSISLVVGQNGVLSKATNAVEKNELGTVTQDIKLGAADAEIAYYDAWVSNQSVQKANYYKEASYYTANATIGTVDAATVALSADGSKVTGTYTVTGGASYDFTVTVATGAVEVTKK